MKTKGYWMGKPIERYNKEELIDIVAHLARELFRTREQHIKDLRFLASLGDK